MLHWILFTFAFIEVNSVQWDVFSTKTLYEWSHDVTILSRDNAEMLTTHNNELCEASHVNAVIRHGARNPSLKNIIKMNKLQEKLIASKPPDTATFINTWKNLYDKEKEKELVEKGIKEQFELGRRFARKFFQLLDSGREEDLVFISSSKSRAKDSSKYFYGGLSYIFSKLEKHENEIDDSLLRFYDDCRNYEWFVENNRTNLREFDNFHKTEEYIGVAKSIRRNLSLNTSLEPDDVYLLYEMCAYEKYINNNEFWCSLMTDADRRVLEYGQDLEKYYESSYGHPLNRKLSCPLIQNIFDTLDDVIDDIEDNENHTVGVFHFGHSETIVQVFTALGLFKDQNPLLATNMADMRRREFRTSEISPYSANIALVLYACGHIDHGLEGDDKDISAFVLKILVNEKPVIIPACNREQCLYKDVRKYYHDLIDHCEHEKLCGDDHDDNDDHDHDDDDNDGDSDPGHSQQLTYSLPLLFFTFIVSNINP